jgi:hypothetical protein
LPGESQLVSKVTNGAAEYAIRRRNAGDPCPLSFSQQRLWFLDQLSPADPSYNIPYAMVINGPLNVSALKRGLDAIIGRHEILRTTFDDVGGSPVSVVADSWGVELQEIDLRSLPKGERERKARFFLWKEACRGFNLARDLMLRGALLRLEDEKHLFLHVSHHVAWEFRSTALMYSELSEFYAHFAAGKKLEVPELPIQFADFALWQRQFLQGTMLTRLGEYWKTQLNGAPNDLDLPIDFPRPVLPTRRGKRYPMVLSSELLEAAKTLSLKSGVTPFMSLLGAFKVLLFCYTGQEDVCVGSPIARRRREEIEPMIGFFVNTLVLRTDLSGRPTFRELLARISRAVLGAIVHADLPFDKLVELLRPPRKAGRMPLFQVNFRAVKEPVPALCLNGLEVSPSEWIDNHTSKFDLSLELVATGGATGFFEYSTELFKDETIAQMALDFDALLRALINSPDVALNELEIVRDIRSRIQKRSRPSI